MPPRDDRSAERVRSHAADGVDHGLALASGFAPSAVRRLLRQLDVHGRRAVNAAEFRRLGCLLGEEWDDEDAAANFAAAPPSRPGLVDYGGLYRWLARHSRCDLAGDPAALRRRAGPREDVVGRHLAAISDTQWALLERLDLDCRHRSDVIAPERGASLASHLVSVRTILSEWGAGEAVCAAGLFHSVYETVAGHQACDVRRSRPRLCAALGEEVERLVYLFQPANACRVETARGDGLWDAPADAGSFFLPGVLQGQPARVEVPAELRLPLLLLYWANDLDQATPRELECGVEYAAGVLRQSRTVMPLLATSGAGEWVASLSQVVERADAGRREKHVKLARGWTKV